MADPRELLVELRRIGRMVERGDVAVAYGRIDDISDELAALVERFEWCPMCGAAPPPAPKPERKDG
jgi:hypothetical protein